MIQYCELILLPRSLFVWDSSNAMTATLFEQQAEISLQNEGGLLCLAWDGMAFKTIHYKSWKPTEK